MVRRGAEERRGGPAHLTHSLTHYTSYRHHHHGSPGADRRLEEVSTFGCWREGKEEEEKMKKKMRGDGGAVTKKREDEMTTTTHRNLSFFSLSPHTCPSSHLPVG